jgi:leucyl aminopeptidase
MVGKGIMYDSGGISLKAADPVHDMMKNDMSGAGAIHAALFLHEFVDGLPWAHIDIAGVADVEKPGGWRTQGCSGFGARLLADFAVDFGS